MLEPPSRKAGNINMTRFITIHRLFETPDWQVGLDPSAKGWALLLAGAQITTLVTAA